MPSEVPDQQKIFHKYQFFYKGFFFFLETKCQHLLVDHETNFIGYN